MLAMAETSEESLPTPEEQTADSLALVPMQPAGQPVVFTPQKPEGEQPNHFWSERAKDEMALRSMRPASLF